MRPVFETDLGKAFCGDSAKILLEQEDCSVDLIVTSPPYALGRKKTYGNVASEQYVEWFRPFANQFHRVLKDTGSLVINLGNTWNRGEPTRSLYPYRLLLDLCEPEIDRPRFHLAQEVYWFNPAKIPNPAEWVTVRRIRVKDAVEPIWWLSKTAYPKSDNRQVLQAYSESMRRLLATQRYNAGNRPSGWQISEKWATDHGGAIPPNFLNVPMKTDDDEIPVDVLAISNTSSNDPFRRAMREKNRSLHPAMFPPDLPEFFIRMLTDKGDLVLDPFCGSNTTGRVAEELGRRWIGIDLDRKFLNDSKKRWSVPTSPRML